MEDELSLAHPGEQRKASTIQKRPVDGQLVGVVEATVEEMGRQQL
jgi:hypothetical protein